MSSVKDKFMPNYWVWIEHREIATRGNQFSIGYVGGSCSSGIDTDDQDMGNVNREDNVNRYQEMVLKLPALNLEYFPNLLMRFPI